MKGKLTKKGAAIQSIISINKQLQCEGLDSFTDYGNERGLQCFVGRNKNPLSNENLKAGFTF
ncbi:hypothetical protein [Fictibacillus terranigra]|uniref:Uncharacterized protein n=1 Tax=Fictibacillus terranigra TaxID=3058424 RepID=A0ABT8EDC7_9BACL|nr:hypothetical protein [Fictibacillus sp. CENA-BCM004]MDN4075910.1 hypothetical protein [Fictibacillus sp. CENA-BCM004]